MRARLPFYVFACASAEGQKPYAVQVRDADHNIVMVSASYGQHAGAPLDGEEKLAIAQAMVDAINATALARVQGVQT